MSGLDEQDIPICPLCEEIPHFWILNTKFREWFWLHSNKCLDDDDCTDRVELGMGTDGRLADVVSVDCAHELVQKKKIHRFESESETFKKVLEMSKRYYTGYM